MLFYLHNTSPLCRRCGPCKTSLDLWGHFHACCHRKYECLSACVGEEKSESPSLALHDHFTHIQHALSLSRNTPTHTRIQRLWCVLFSGDSKLRLCAQIQIQTHKANQNRSLAGCFWKSESVWCVCMYISSKFTVLRWNAIRATQGSSKAQEEALSKASICSKQPLYLCFRQQSVALCVGGKLRTNFVSASILFERPLYLYLGL